MEAASRALGGQCAGVTRQMRKLCGMQMDPLRIAARTRTQYTASFKRHLVLAKAAGGRANGKALTLLWHKADLRTDDHPGLQAALKAQELLPVFILDLDKLEYLTFTPGGPEVLVASLRSLKAELQALGSDLVVLQGRWDQLPSAASALGAQQIIAQQEVDFRLGEPTSAVLESVKSQGVAVEQWAPLTWSPINFRHNFREWQVQRGQPSLPVPAPSSLPPVPQGNLEFGKLQRVDIPTAQELRHMLESHHGRGLSEPGVAELSQSVLKSALEGPDAQRQQRLISSGRTWLQLLAVYLGTKAPAETQPRGLKEGAGTNGAGSNGGPAGIQAVMEGWVAQLETPAAEGVSFPALFGVAMTIGALSRRRVYHLAQQALQSAEGTAVQKQLRTWTAQMTESNDFHQQLAMRNDRRPPAAHPGIQQRHWRWRGLLTDFCSMEPTNGDPNAPALLLIHGFGAFGDHWRDVLKPLADAGYRVYAPTLPGFGRSEKVAAPYSQVLWSEFIRDFSLQVVKGPVVMAGNSIGGFIATSAAADFPGLVRGLILLNSAGPITPKFSETAWLQSVEKMVPPPKILVKMFCGALFWYLERTVLSTLKWLYPTAPNRVDDWLEWEISRAAADAGAVAVFSAVAYLPPPRPLNWLINERFKHPTLVLQGALDPLNDAKGRAAELARLCPEHVTVQLLQAGHCPHDEVPDQVAQHMIGFMKQVMQRSATAPASVAAR